MEMSGQLQAAAALPPGKNYFAHRIVGWVDDRAGLDGFEMTRGRVIVPVDF